MKKHWVGAILTSCFLLLTACSAGKAGPEQTGGQASTEEKGAYHKIDAKEAKRMMDEGNVTVVDVRRAEEYAQKHIPGALLVPNETIAEEAAEKLPDKEAVYLVHCRTGVRSKQAAEKLIELGYQNIYDFGGIVDWPFAVESGEASR